MPVDLDAIAKQLLAEAGEDADVSADIARQFLLQAFVPGQGFETIDSAVETRPGELEISAPQLFSGSSFFIRTPGDRITLIGVGSEETWDKRLRYELGAYGKQASHFDNVIIPAPHREQIGGATGLLYLMTDIDRRARMAIPSGGAYDDMMKWIPHLYVGKRFAQEGYRSIIEESGRPGIGQVFLPGMAAYNRRLREFQSQLESEGIPHTVVGSPNWRPKPPSLAEQSLVTRVQYDDFSALFLGPAGRKLQQQLVEYGGESLKSTLLVAPRGFAEDLDPRLLDLIAPEAIIVAGSDRLTGAGRPPAPGTFQFEAAQPEALPYNELGQRYATIRPGVPYAPGFAGAPPGSYGKYPVFQTDVLDTIEITSTGTDWKLEAPYREVPIIDIPATRGMPIPDPSKSPSRVGVSPYVGRTFLDFEARRTGALEDPRKSLKSLGGGRFRGFVTGVEDADTVTIEGLGSVRLIGINAPEMNRGRMPTQYKGLPVFRGDYRDSYERLGGRDTVIGIPAAFAERGKQALTRMISGKEVQLEFDEELRDIYNRPLAYIFVGDTFVNEELLRLGLAVPYEEYPGTKYKELFSAASDYAKKGQYGLWPHYEEAFPVVRPTPKIRKQPHKRKQSALDGEMKEISQMIGFMPGMDYGITQHFSDSRVEYPV